MISFVCGQLCSGKTLYSEALRNVNYDSYIEVGDIVRRLKSSEDRKVLQDSKDMLTHIIEYLRIEEKTFNHLIVSGVRQKEILEAFPDATLLWIECPTELRKQRYLNRSREGDTQTFEEAEQGDINLGILEVKKYIFNNTI
jgi:dephospho-CoA kinase